MPVPVDVTPRYRAFLSYSHKDRRWGEWLHRKLEGWSIPAELVGRTTPLGEVPKSLRPIFRDRDDLSAAHSLTDKIREALHQSLFLIVVSSPNSAASRYVNEEVRQFKAMGGKDRILPIIIDGEPGDNERECFPPALRFAVGPDGNITETPEEPVAADARDVGDGHDLARMKLIAGLLGVNLDVIRKRELIAQRRRMAAIAAVAVVMAGLAVASGVLYIKAEQRRREAEQNLQNSYEKLSIGAIDIIRRWKSYGDLPGEKLSKQLNIDFASVVNLAGGNPFSELPSDVDAQETAIARSLVDEVMAIADPLMREVILHDKVAEMMTGVIEIPFTRLFLRQQKSRWMLAAFETYNEAGEKLLNFNRAEDALSRFERSAALAAGWLQEHDTPRWRLRQADALGRVAKARELLGQTAEALESLQKARQFLTAIKDPDWEDDLREPRRRFDEEIARLSATTSGAQK